MAGGLNRAETVLLRNGGTADPLDRRPITLLPMLYRVWAALRATQLRAWMRSAGIPTLVTGSNSTMGSAEHQGLYLGLELEEARAFDDNLAGVAVDWSKCAGHPASCRRPSLGFGPCALHVQGPSAH